MGEPASSSGGIVAPKLAPSTSASAGVTRMTPDLTGETIDSTTATLEWHNQVTTGAAKSASRGTPESLDNRPKLRVVFDRRHRSNWQMERKQHQPQPNCHPAQIFEV